MARVAKARVAHALGVDRGEIHDATASVPGDVAAAWHSMPSSIDVEWGSMESLRLPRFEPGRGSEALSACLDSSRARFGFALRLARRSASGFGVGRDGKS